MKRRSRKPARKQLRQRLIMRVGRLLVQEGALDAMLKRPAAAKAVLRRPAAAAAPAARPKGAARAIATPRWNVREHVLVRYRDDPALLYHRLIVGDCDGKQILATPDRELELEALTVGEDSRFSEVLRWSGQGK